jgi:site-specific recombinase XerD
MRTNPVNATSSPSLLPVIAATKKLWRQAHLTYDKETAADAQITKRVYSHLLRHSVATTLLERGMPIEQIQKFLGHSMLETTQIYAESSAEMIKASYPKAFGE